MAKVTKTVNKASKPKKKSGGTASPAIQLSANSILESAANGSTIGTLSVSNPPGGTTYSFSKLSDPDSKFAVSGTALQKNATLDYEAAQSHQVTIRATPAPSGSVIDKTFTIFVSNVLEVTLAALTLSASVIAENSAPGTLVGAVNGKTANSTLSLQDDAGGRFALSGNNIVAGLVATNFEAATSHNITIRETHADGINSPRDTTLAITVTNVAEQPSLAALTLSASTIAESSAAGTDVGTVQGLTAGSTLTMTDTAGSRFALSAGHVVAGSVATDFETATSHNITLRETLADSPNSPRDTVIAITVTDIADSPDTTAPLLSLPSNVADVYEGAGSALNVGVTTNEGSGTLYCVATFSNTAPTKAQVKTGQDHTGAAAPGVGTPKTVSASGVQSLQITGLLNWTDYYVHFMHEDSSGNQSNVATSGLATPQLMNRIPRPPVSPGADIIITAAGLTINTFVQDKVYRVLSGTVIPSATRAMNIVAGGILRRVKLIIEAGASVNVAIGGSAGECEDVEIQGNGVTSYGFFSVGSVKGCCMARDCGIPHRLENISGVAFPATAMMKGIDPTSTACIWLKNCDASTLAGTFVAISTGALAGSVSAMKMTDTSVGNTIGALYTEGYPGYCLSISNYSNDNEIDYIYAVGEQGDPCIAFTDGSSGNTINTLECWAWSVAVNFGELSDLLTGDPCNNNRIINLYAEDIGYGAIRFADGNDNRVDTAVLKSIGSLTSSGIPNPGAVAFARTPLSEPSVRPVDGCSVGSLTVQSGTRTPQYTVHFGPLASNNYVEAIVAEVFSIARLLDESFNANVPVPGSVMPKQTVIPAQPSPFFLNRTGTREVAFSATFINEVI